VGSVTKIQLPSGAKSVSTNPSTRRRWRGPPISATEGGIRALQTAVLLAAAVHRCGPDPGSQPQYRTLAGIVIEGIEDPVDIADDVA